MNNNNSISIPSATATSSSGVLDKKKLLINYLKQQQQNPTKYSITNKGTETVAIASSSSSSTAATSTGSVSSSSNWKSKRYEEAKSRSRQSLKAKKQNTNLLSTKKSKDKISHGDDENKNVQVKTPMTTKSITSTTVPTPATVPLKRNTSMENVMQSNSPTKRNIMKLSHKIHDTKQKKDTIKKDNHVSRNENGKTQPINSTNNSIEKSNSDQGSDSVVELNGINEDARNHKDTTTVHVDSDKTEIGSEVLQKKQSKKSATYDRPKEIDPIQEKTPGNYVNEKEGENGKSLLKEEINNNRKKDPDFEEFMDELKREMKSEHTEVSLPLFSTSLLLILFFDFSIELFPFFYFW